MCGYHKVVQTQLQSVIIEHNEMGDEIKLPKRQSNLWFTLMTLASLLEANSAEITRRLIDLGCDFTVSDVASYLTILRSKGLVRNTVVRRGMPGGSSWVLTDKCNTMIGA